MSMQTHLDMANSQDMFEANRMYCLTTAFQANGQILCCCDTKFVNVRANDGSDQWSSYWKNWQRAVWQERDTMLDTCSECSDIPDSNPADPDAEPSPITPDLADRQRDTLDLQLIAAPSLAPSLAPDDWSLAASSFESAQPVSTYQVEYSDTPYEYPEAKPRPTAKALPKRLKQQYVEEMIEKNTSEIAKCFTCVDSALEHMGGEETTEDMQPSDKRLKRSNASIDLF